MRLLNHLPILLAVLSFSGIGCAQHGQHQTPVPSRIEVPSGGVSLPMQDFGGRPIVDIKIGGKGPYRFILDTGASITVLGEEINKELGLQSPHGVQAVSAGGGKAPVVVVIPELQMGDAKVHDVFAAVMPLASVAGANAAGVLSASSFPGYLLTFDYPGKRILLRKGELPKAGSNGVVEYGAERAVPAVPIRIAGRDTVVDLDTGAGEGLTLPLSFLKELPLTSEPKEGKKLRTIGREFPVLRATIKAPLEVGGHKVDLDEISFSDARPGSGPPPGTIGYAALRAFVLTLDAKNRRVQFERP